MMSGHETPSNSPFLPILEGRSNWKEWNQHLEAVLSAEHNNLLDIITGVEKRPEDIVAAAASIESMIKEKLSTKGPNSPLPSDTLEKAAPFEGLPALALPSLEPAATMGKQYQATWDAKNKLALGYLTSTIHERLSHHVVKGRTAYEVYESLRAVCDDNNLLSPCLKTIRWTSYKYIPGQSFSTFLQKWRYYLAEMRASYPPDQQVPLILCYHIFIAAVSNNPACVPWLNTLSMDRTSIQEQDMATLYTEFLAAESRRTGRYIEQPSRPSPSVASHLQSLHIDRGSSQGTKGFYSKKEEEPWCAIHKRRGHTTKDCWSNPRNPLSRRPNILSSQPGPSLGSPVKAQPLRPAVPNNEKDFHSYLSDDGAGPRPATEPRRMKSTPKPSYYERLN